MRISSPLLASSGLAMGLTAIAVAVILLASNFTIINAQQQEEQQLTSQPGEIENGTTPAATTTFQSTNDSFRVQVPDGWIIQDLNNTGSTEAMQGYGILAQLCPEEQQGAAALTNASGGSTNSISSINTSSCQEAQDIIHIIRYPDLDTRLLTNNITTTNNNMTTTDNILTYHLRKLQEVGYRSIQIVNSTDVTSNLTNPQTNETITTEPAKLVEMTYSTNSAPNEARRGYFILTATNATAPNLGTTKGYSVFYEGNSTTTATAEITTASGSLPPPPAVGQVFNSFELIAAPEVVQAAETAEEGDDDGDDNGGDGGDTSCHPSYPDTCIPPPPPNLNCDDVDATNFEVVGSDPHGFDGDNDGIGCEDGNADGDGDDNGGDGDGDDNGGDGDGDDNGGDGDGDDNGGDGDEGEGNAIQNALDEFGEMGEECIIVGDGDVGDVGC